jgi:hypothetical protein
MKAHFIRSTSTKKMISAWEGADSLAHAEYLITVHNKLYPNDTWFISTEVI